jgi:hypothetical protein
VGWWGFNGGVTALGPYLVFRLLLFRIRCTQRFAGLKKQSPATFDGLLHFAAKPQRLARDVFTCYEAGAFGFHLHRKPTQMGVTNYVVQPQDWDERGKGVPTDRIDALAL